MRGAAEGIALTAGGGRAGLEAAGGRWGSPAVCLNGETRCCSANERMGCFVFVCLFVLNIRETLFLNGLKLRTNECVE